MGKMTLQEFADLHGVYTARRPNGYRIAYSIKPIQTLDDWLYDGDATIINMFTKPDESDWRDSLHSPRVVCPECGGSGLQYCNSVLMGFCPTCHGTGWVEREEG